MILDTIVEAKRKRLAEQKKNLSFAELKEKIINKNQDTANEVLKPDRTTGRFADSLVNHSGIKKISVIAEVKKASPSKGIISSKFDYLGIAANYEQLGASAISVLTEEDYFLGSPEYLREIRQEVKIPLLRKDFIIDPYQIYEAKLLGADAILLIVRLLEDLQLKEFLKIAEEIGLDSLVEVHDEAEAEQALKAGTKIIGVNNRDLQTFAVDLEHSRRIGAMIPASVIKVSESGIHSVEDIRMVHSWGFDAVLVGEALMKADNLTQKFAEFQQV
ncbi:indole-3-glycerol phosphate synthase TrpC [Dehalobacter sp. DCM]|uniref:indole-3-glycerol phosphate synthase TrpC n=1 Tax=Dehalobacter sp. DCM TaxID=2907827 RepID=UPI0030812CB2|nr:indole-3-glycerol phosphate synthase TrpC [Dehalobacter sp. DCM]